MGRATTRAGRGMTDEQKERGQRRDRRAYEMRRTMLIMLMGCKCFRCSERRPESLEFHHLFEPSWRPHKTSRLRRIKLYARDWGNGELTLACGTHNKQAGAPPRKPGAPPEEPMPF